MASTYTPLGVELMATGENAGTWGTKTNTNLQIFEQISGGYLEVAIGGGGATAVNAGSGSSAPSNDYHGTLDATQVIGGAPNR